MAANNATIKSTFRIADRQSYYSAFLTTIITTINSTILAAIIATICTAVEYTQRTTF